MFKFNVIFKDKLKSNNILQFSYTDEQIVDLIKNPIVKSKTVDEDNVFLLKFGYVEGKFENHSSTLSKSVIKGISHLILEYDNKEKVFGLIEKFKEKYKKYRWYLYSTKSSNKMVNKFRVIFPLKRMITPFDVFKNEDVLRRKFTIKDGRKETCFDPSCLLEKQFQREPYCEDIKRYEWFVNKGKRLAIKRYKANDTINFKSFGDIDDNIKEDYEKGKEYLDKLIEMGWNKPFHSTPRLEERYKEFNKKITEMTKPQFCVSLVDSVKRILKKHKLDINGYNVATKLAWLNVENGGVYKLSEIMKAYKDIIGKPMSDDKLRKYESCYEKCAVKKGLG